MKKALNISTYRTYSSVWDTFRRFATLHGIADPLLLSSRQREELFILFATHCAVHLNLRYNTIQYYLSAIKFNYITLAPPCVDPMSYPNGAPFVRLGLTLKGIKKSSTGCRMVRDPITLDMLRKFCKVLSRGLYGPYVDILLKAMFTLAFFGFLRCGEFTSCTDQFDPSVGLTLQDLEFLPSPSSAFSLHLKASKTDQDRKGISIDICATYNEVCPVNAMRQYIRVRKQLCKDIARPLFLLPGGMPVTRRLFVQWLDGVQDVLNLPKHSLKPHSFRIGAATAAAQAGVPDHLIKTLGRWSSNCYQIYIRTPLSVIQRAHKSMAAL